MTWRRTAIVMGTKSTSSFGDQLIGPNDPTHTQVGFNTGYSTAGRLLIGFRRNGQVAAGYVEESLNDFPGFHDLLDPTTPKRSRGFEIRDFIQNIIAVGACSYAWGILEHLIANDPTSLVGVGFEHASDYVLKTFLKDTNPVGGAARTLHQVSTGITADNSHELLVRIDGYLKTVSWYIDSTLVDTYTPAAPLEQMGGSNVLMSPKYRYRGVVPANGDMTIRFYGGEVQNPILTIREFDGT